MLLIATTATMLTTATNPIPLLMTNLSMQLIGQEPASVSERMCTPVCKVSEWKTFLFPLAKRVAIGISFRPSPSEPMAHHGPSPRDYADGTSPPDNRTASDHVPAWARSGASARPSADVCGVCGNARDIIVRRDFARARAPAGGWQRASEFPRQLSGAPVGHKVRQGLDAGQIRQSCSRCPFRRLCTHTYFSEAPGMRHITLWSSCSHTVLL